MAEAVEEEQREKQREPRRRSVLCASPAGLHRMAYREWGDPRNRDVLVCVHGLTRSSRDFDELARVLCAQFRVVCPDVAGRGDSDRLADAKLYTWAQYVADMVTLIARLDVEAEWERDGERGRAVIENGQLVESSAAQRAEAPVEVWLGEKGRLGLGLICRAQPDGSVIGYAVTDERHTYFRFRDGALELLSPEEPDAALEEAAFGFVDEWIWYDEEEAALERARYANYGYPVRGANLKSEKLALLRKGDGKYSSLNGAGEAAREAVVKQWLKK